MVNKFIGGAAALSVASVLVLAGCSGGGRLTPAVGDGMSAPAIMAPAAVGAIVYKGPKVSNKPEIDLFSTTINSNGYSSSFTLTQSGFAGAFTYGYKAKSGFANNCPKTAHASYTISPASGKKAANGKYTVKATSKGAAGACTVTFTGGSKKTIAVTFTFTTSGVVITQPRPTR